MRWNYEEYDALRPQLLVVRLIPHGASMVLIPAQDFLRVEFQRSPYMYMKRLQHERMHMKDDEINIVVCLLDLQRIYLVDAGQIICVRY